MVVYNDLSDNERIRVYDVASTRPRSARDRPRDEMPVTYRTGDITSPYVEFVEPLLVQDSHFIDCVRTGRRPDTLGDRGLGSSGSAPPPTRPARPARPRGFSRLRHRIPTTVAQAEVAS